MQRDGQHYLLPDAARRATLPSPRMQRDGQHCPSPREAGRGRHEAKRSAGEGRVINSVSEGSGADGRRDECSLLAPPGPPGPSLTFDMTVLRKVALSWNCAATSARR